MDFLNDWGGLIGLIGAILSLIGLTAALLAAQRAEKARDAAEEAKIETRTGMNRTLVTIELSRATAALQRLKDLHRDRRWDISLEYYHILQVSLADISTWHPDPSQEIQETLRAAILQIQEIEERVDTASLIQSDLTELPELNRILNEILSQLREISISLHSSEN